MKNNLFVQRPIFALVIAIMIVILGYISIMQLPVAQYPDITPPMVQVTANYEGADAVNVEQSATIPLEESINGVTDMIYMTSTSAGDGSMIINVSFEVGSNPDMNTVFTENKVATATPELPTVVTELGVATQKTMNSIMMVLSIYSPDNSFDGLFLNNYIDLNIKDELARIDGVGSVSVMGSGTYAMRIWLDAEKLGYLGISVAEVEEAVITQNTIIPGGKFGAEPTSAETPYTYTILMPNQKSTTEEFGNIIIRTLEDGSQVLLKDVASLSLGSEAYNVNATFEDKNCAVILIYQAPGSNAIELAKQVTAKMKTVSKKFPPGVDYKVIVDSTTPVVAGIKEILLTLAFALFLVILVIYLFIQNARATLIPIIAIPVSLIGAFILFPTLSFSINVLSLLGLILAVGIVVDDAIVVVEAVQVNIEKGMHPKEATLQAMKSVSTPIIATTIVMIAVFVPVSMMGGITGMLYQQFAVTIAFSVLISAINALSLSPALCSLLLRPKPKIERQKEGLLDRFFDGFNRVFGLGVKKYLSATDLLIRKFKRGFIFIFILIGGTYYILTHLPQSFLPNEDQGYIMLSVQLPNASSLTRTEEVVKEIDALIKKYEFVEYTAALSGFNILSQSQSTYAGVIWVKLVDWDKRSISTAAFANKLNGEMYFAISDAMVYAFGPPAIPGLGTGSGFSLVLLDNGGNTPQYLAEQADLFLEACKSEPAIGMVTTTFEANVPQKAFSINESMVLKAGVNLSDLHSTLSSFMGGAYINRFNRFGRIYNTYLEADPKFRQNEQNLNQLFIQNENGDNFPLSSFITVIDTIGPDYLDHYNLYRSASIMGQSAPGYSSGQTTKALERVASKTLPADMGYAWTNMSYQEQHAGSGITAMSLSLVFVFLILAALYESWSLPFTILLGTPFVILGASSFLYFGRFIDPIYSDDIYFQISLIMLVAMAAKNAILIIQYAHTFFEEEGLSLKDAALKAAHLRIRPIIMTSFAFICGILPLIWASGANAMSRKIIGLALLGGMLLATLLGVFFYPMFYVAIGKLIGYKHSKSQNATDQTEKE